MLRTLTTAAIVVLTVSTAQAFTRDISVNVPFGDLNLTHPQDAKILAGRLQAAASQVCQSPDASAPADPDAHRKMQACMNTAINLAMARIQSKLDRAVRVYLVASNDTP